MANGDDALELMKSGNQQALERMKTAVQTGDPCDPKHQKAINASVIPFAERAFELHELEFARLTSVQPDKKMEIPIPFSNGKSIKGESRDVMRVACLILIGFLCWMMWTDKEERKQAWRDLNHSKPYVEKTDVSSTAMNNK